MMKILKPFITLLLFFLLSSLSAQEIKSSFLVSINMAHFDRAGTSDQIQGFYKFPVDPGLEISYQYQLSNTFIVRSGISYQLAHFADWQQAMRRFRFKEISIPLIFNKIFALNLKRSLFLSSGIYAGKVIELELENPTSWNEWVNISAQHDDHYSVASSFVDGYLDGGLRFLTNRQNSLLVSPFLKYRFKDNWIGYYRERLHYGIKISYQFKI